MALTGRHVLNIDAHERPGDFSWAKRADDGITASILLSCPACGALHAVGVKPGDPNGREWNQDRDKPTLTPSMWFKSGHVQHGYDNGCRWHGFLTNGVFTDA